MIEQLHILRHFVSARWGHRFKSRAALETWQQKKLDQFLRKLADESPFYQNFKPVLQSFPVMDKASYGLHFSELNPNGISLEEAELTALQAEASRNFNSTLPHGVTVGLSSGTSGKSGVFLVSPEDRCRWAGIILARALSSQSLMHLLNPLKPRLKIAFFLRANSNLYQTIASRRVDFRYFDLLGEVEGLVRELEKYQPDILIAPATVLAEFSKKDGLSIRPFQVISVAEVLDQRDSELIRRKFRIAPSQLYQATEGFIGFTCPAGNLHLNEEYLHVERDWLDDERSRFHPIITDFSRTGQYFVRYRLDDILHASDQNCTCGRKSRVIRSIEGRSDEVLRFPSPLFPDVLRQALYSMPDPPDLYRMEQHEGVLKIFLRHSTSELEKRVGTVLQTLFKSQNLPLPRLIFPSWTEQLPGEKQRRIKCVTPILP